MWGRVKELFRIPPLLGVGAAQAPLPILTTTPSKLKWTVLTDRSIGGKSEATFKVLAHPPSLQASEDDTDVSKTKGGQIKEETEAKDTKPVAVFSGHLSMLRPSADPSVKRTGYCAVKIEFPRPLKVENYEGLELKVRTDGRNYVTNLEVDSFFPDELYQGYITGLPPGKWWTVQLPFRDMTLTRLGRLSYIQRELDSSFTLESIGFLVADGKSGDFCLEIGGVAAVAKVEGRPLAGSSSVGGEREEMEKEEEEEVEGKDSREKTNHQMK